MKAGSTLDHPSDDWRIARAEMSGGPDAGLTSPISDPSDDSGVTIDNWALVSRQVLRTINEIIDRIACPRNS